MSMPQPPKPPWALQRRVATAPVMLQSPTRPPQSASTAEAEVDTLFNHANAKVVSLVALSDQTFSLESSNRDTIGPWQSHFERTIAIGSLRLYRAHGSVAFLSCGNALQPIFPKSQCWCMEEDGSKFILQIRPPSYWRIELATPLSGQDDLSLRNCLASVLLLDKTPCPFKESVPISLPSESIAVSKRRPWRPLRSYPSEPILLRETGEMGERQGNYNRDSIDSQPIAEHQSEGGSVVACSEARENMTEQRATSDDVDAGKRHLSVPLSPLRHTPENTPDQAMSETMAVEGQEQAGAPIEQEEQNEMKRRYTIASSWQDADMDTLMQTTTSISFHENDFMTMIDTQPAERADVKRLLTEQHKSRLRLRRSGPGDTTVEESRQQPIIAIAVHREGDSQLSDALTRTIYMLFYAICGIVVLAGQGTIGALRDWWRKAVA